MNSKNQIKSSFLYTMRQKASVTKSLIVVLGAVVTTFFILAQTQTGQLKVVLKDSKTANPIPSATIILLQNGKQIMTSTSDSNGIVTIKNIKTGVYDVKAIARGYTTQHNTGLQINKKTKELIIKMKSAKEQTIEVIKKKDGTKLAPISTDVPLVEKVIPINNSTISMDGSAGEISYMMHAPTIEPYPVETNTESYAHVKENDFIISEKEPLSTFSIDVDRASYSNVRRFINGGQLPPKDAIRTEELINYFPYQYTKNNSQHPVSIQTELTETPWQNQHYLVKIAMNAINLDPSKAPDNNLVFLIDVSGSMSDPNKLPLVKSSLSMLIDQLKPKDRIALVVYAGAAGLVLPSTPISEKQKIKEALENLSAGGSTAGGEGIELAYKTAKEHFITEGNNRVILCTDGDFNVGISSEKSLESLIEEKRKDGVYLTVLGYGMGNYKDSRMEVLADKGNGNYAYIDNIQEAKKTLVNEMLGTLYTVAKDVKIQIEFNPTLVKAYRLIGYENRLLAKEDFNNDLKDAGEVGAGHQVTALYEIVPVGVKSNFVGSVDDLKYSNNTEKKRG